MADLSVINILDLIKKLLKTKYLQTAYARLLRFTMKMLSF